MSDPAISSDESAQQLVLETLVQNQLLQSFNLYAYASEPTHLHVVAAWRGEIEAVQMRARIKSSLSRALNKAFGRRRWFVAKAGQTKVRDERHLSQLVYAYLPKHNGFYWCKVQHDEADV